MRAFSKVIIKICAGAVAVGLLLVVIGLVSGAGNDIDWRQDLNWEKGAIRNKKLMDIDREYEDVESIDLDIQFGEVEIRQGDTFRIEGYDLQEEFSSQVVEGVWKINDGNKRSDKDWSFRIWNLNFNALGGYEPKLIIYLPKDFEADEFNLKMGAGKVTIDSLVSNRETNIGVGAGDIEINRILASNATINCGAGKVSIIGNLIGNSYVECNVGEVRLDLDGVEEDYSYDVKCNLGSVSINRQEFDFNISINRDSGDTENNLDLNCNIGEIVVTTK